MSFPKYSARSLRDKYPEAETVLQVRFSTREGDSVSYEGVCPPGIKDILMGALFEQSLKEACAASHTSDTSSDKQGGANG